MTILHIKIDTTHALTHKLIENVFLRKKIVRYFQVREAINEN